MFTKKFHGRGGANFHGGKLTPENASQENCPPGNLPPIPQRKKKWLQKILSLR